MTDLTKLDWSKCELPKLPEHGCGYFSGMQIKIEVFEENELSLQISGVDLYWLWRDSRKWNLNAGTLRSYTNLVCREFLRALDAATVIVDKFIEENTK